MDLNPQLLKAGRVCVLVLLATLDCPPARPATSATPSKAASCAAPEYRQFDFGLGDWDAFEVDHPTKAVARARVTLVLDGCVLWEQYDGADGSRGQSFSIYDASRKVWHQSWVTNRGRLLTIEGEMQADEMVLAGIDRTIDGQERHVRGTWKPVTGGVQETAVISLDGGKTWNLWFDLIFRPHKT